MQFNHCYKQIITNTDYKRNNVEAAMFQYSFYTCNCKTRYRGKRKHRIPAFSRCMWMNLRRMVIFYLSTFQRPILALCEPLRETFGWLNILLVSQIRKPVVCDVSFGMSVNDNTEYLCSYKTATF